MYCLYHKRIFAVGTVIVLILYCGVMFNLQAEDKQPPVSGPKILKTNVPDHEIKYEDEFSPDWKVNWDRARQLYRENKYREALVQYELLLAQKENIDEARWEYTSILLHLERWQKAKYELERLISSESNNRNYLFALAQVYLKTGKVDKSVKLYGQLYEQASVDPEAVRALEGLTSALERQADNEALLPLLEQLIVRKPGDIGLQKKLALLAMEMRKFDKAEKTLHKLEQDDPDDVYVLQCLAELYEQKGKMDQAAVYWQKLISVDPENSDAHERLQHYYCDRNNWQMSLKHVEKLLKIQPHKFDLLETAAELNLKTGRIDKALEYYDYLLVIKPGNKGILQKKKETQQILAADLLALVENEGSQQLWQDLVKVTSDRPGVYREIAFLLRKKQKNDELIEVLVLICQEDPDDIQTLTELKELLKEKGRSRELTVLLNSSSQ